MPEPTITKAKAWQKSGPILMARVVGNANANITQASLTAITLSHWDLRDVSTEASTDSLVVADVVFDTLQTPAVWTADAIGYNFRYDVPAAKLPKGDRRYRFEFICDPVSGDDFAVVFEVSTKDLLKHAD